jgi:nicotinate-nucleotide adenylyltransferase
MTRIGIFGGTFDPPHLAHLILAETCAEALGLERVLWVPAADPPHKHGAPIAAARHRMAMVEAAIAGNERFALSHVDVDRPGPHYSADMVEVIAGSFDPGDELYFLMGGDSLHDLPRWHEPERLIARCRLAVMRRPADGMDAALESLCKTLPALASALRFVPAPLIEISGAEVRRRVRAGLSVRYLVPETVAAYIAREGLYK